MSDAFQDFDKRLRRIHTKRVKLSNGYVSVVGGDGLIVVKPRRRRTILPLRPLVFVILGFLAFKVIILATLGQLVYEERIEALREGSTVEQAGAWVMQADPWTVMLAQKLRATMR